METLSVTFAGDPQTYHVITDCNESDTCPGCGAGYKAGFIECEYCRRPVRRATTQQYRAVVFDEGGNATLRHRKLVTEDISAIVHTGETIIPKAWA